MNRFLILPAIAFAAFTLSATGQNVPPVVSSQIADFTEFDGGTRAIDLSPAFSDPDVSNAVRFTTVLGNIDIALFGQQKPITVTNFLKYVDQGRYFLFDATANQTASSFVHRSIPGFIIQGGGYIGTVDEKNPSAVLATQVAPLPQIQNEPGISNKRGTIAMAQIAGNPNSAASEWFINLADNGGPPRNLDIQTTNNGMTSGPYTVFGRVVNNTMTAVDAIAAVPRFNFQPPVDNLPLRNYTQADYNSGKRPAVSNLVSIPGISQISPLSFSASSDNASVSVTVSGTRLLVKGESVGTAHITVTATDFDGAMVSQIFTVNVIPAPGRLVNLSTRMQVGTGDNALFVGFIMSGANSKRLAIRALGPSSGLPNPVANPVLELHDANTTIAMNDNWGDATNKQEITEAGLNPGSPNESVILTTVPSNTSGVGYTAVMRGVNDTTGLGVVEVYDLDSGPGATLLNVSTRGQVGVDPNALIAGLTLGGADPKQILVRAIGPSLTAFGVPGALSDPTLELHDSNGGLLDSNDDWTNSPQKTQIQNSGFAPSNSKESAVLQTLPAGAYTAVVHGMNGGTGVASVEVYQLP
jgi:cyclophilin family peptidyl-prolyl cis-trans isomerase